MRSNLSTIIISIIYWTFALLLLVTFRFLGIDFFLTEPLGFPLIEIYIITLPGGLIMGILWGLLEIADHKFIKKQRRSFGATVFTKTIIYSLIFIVVTFFAAWIGSDSRDLALAYSLSNISLGNFIYFLLASFLYHFFKQMNKKFGSGILLKYLFGKYFNPKEESRIFMFLDLKSSTSIAENLNHILYSKLLQDCFNELTIPVIQNKGQIYQYAGDEAIITWIKEDGLNKANCLCFFYDFIKRIEQRKEYFKTTYNLFPEFKAGISSGQVTTAEIGEIKTEIVFHGDVLNTASRIQGYCNVFNKRLLVSEEIVQLMEANKNFIFNFMDELQLRGKESLSKIYSCEPNME